MRLITAVIALGLMSEFAMAAPFTLSRSIRCNSEQTACVVRTTRLTIGDKVGFFNDQNEITAKGVVKSIKDDRRVIQITDSYGKVSSDDRIDTISSSGNYKVVQSENRFKVGGAFGYGSYSISGNMNVFEVTGYASWSKQVWGFDLPQGLSLVARAGVISGSDDLEKGADKVEFSLLSFGVLGGVAYEGFRKSAVSVRGELALGGAFNSAELKGDFSDMGSDENRDYWDITVTDGFNFLLNGYFSLHLNNFGKWHPMLGASLSLHSSAKGRTLWIGLVRDIH